MKKIKVLLLLLVSMFTINVYATSSKFEGMVNVNSKLSSDNTIQVLLSFKGEEVNNIKLKVSYEKEYLTYDGITFMDGYYAESKELANDDKWNTIDFNAVCNTTSIGDTYAIITFIVNKPDKTKNTSLFFYNYEAKGSEDYTYIDNGEVVELKVDGSDIITNTRDIDKSIKREYWLKENISTFIIFGSVVVLLVIIILLMPGSVRKENRRNKIKNKVKNS